MTSFSVYLLFDQTNRLKRTYYFLEKFALIKNKYVLFVFFNHLFLGGERYSKEEF